MDPRSLQCSFEKNRSRLLDFVRKIKRNSPHDLFSVINPTLILNPYASRFPLHFFAGTMPSGNMTLLFVKATLRFYLKNFYKLAVFTATHLLYRLFSQRKKLSSVPMAIDLFFLVDPILEKRRIEENYFPGLYDVLDKHGIDYVFLARLYGIRHNPFKILPLLKLFERDGRKFIFEFDLLGSGDFLALTGYLLRYPFKTLRLLQQGSGNLDAIFNAELMNDIKNTSFESLTRYVFAKRIVKHTAIEKIYSWHEFQAPDRSFAYALKAANPAIELIACQLYLNYPAYLNSVVEDIDAELGTAPHRVLVNGKQYLQHREKVAYEIGPSLRYKGIFEWDQKTPLQRNEMVVLGSHSLQETRLLLRSAVALKRPFLYKSHPTLSQQSVKPYLTNNVTLTDENIYRLFKQAGIILTSASGTAVEAVACGVSVIIVASRENLTSNPLAECGKGKIWEIVFSQDEVESAYNRLMAFRGACPQEVLAIAQWYKEQFFCEPTEENIVHAFGLQ